jgi:hypothetical protein
LLQGCNSALEDAAVLGQVLEQLLARPGRWQHDPADLGNVLAAEYDRARRADAHALQELEQAASYLSRRKALTSPLPWRLRLHYERLRLLAGAHRLFAARLPGVLGTARGAYTSLYGLLLGPCKPSYARVLGDMRLAAAWLGLAAVAGVAASALALWMCVGY